VQIFLFLGEGQEQVCNLLLFVFCLRKL
jgi:hypothetical protein